MDGKPLQVTKTFYTVLPTKMVFFKDQVLLKFSRFIPDEAIRKG